MKKNTNAGWVYMYILDGFDRRVKLGKYMSKNVLTDCKFYMERGFVCSLETEPTAGIPGILRVTML